MIKKILVLLATCTIAATSLHFTGCAANKAPKARLLPSAETAITAPFETEALSKEKKNAEDVNLNRVAQINTEVTDDKAPDLPAESNPQAEKTAAKPAAKKSAKKTAKKTSKKKATKKAAKKTAKPAKKTTENTSDRKARDAKRRQLYMENHGKRRDTLHRDKIIRDGGALVDWH